jgi:hypothetical protein
MRDNRREKQLRYEINIKTFLLNIYFAKLLPKTLMLVVISIVNVIANVFYVRTFHLGSML